MKEGRVKLTKVTASSPLLKSDASGNHSSEFFKTAHKTWKNFNVEVLNFFNKRGIHGNATTQEQNKPLLKYVFPKLTENQMQYLRWGTIGILLLLLVFLSVGLKFVQKPKGKQIW